MTLTELNYGYDWRIILTYNKYLTDGIQDGTIPYIMRDGIRVYKVRLPHRGEEVMGHTSFSGWVEKQTPTQEAEVKR